MEIALSSGCFLGHEEEISASKVKYVELSGSPAETVDGIIASIESSGGHILGIHCPCPNRGVGLNLGGEGQSWTVAERAILEAAEIGRRCRAEYLLVHAFYCITDDLPSGDIERMRALRALSSNAGSITEYVHSEQYAISKARAIANLKLLLPRIKREYPTLKLLIENLNPRIGYGGIVFQDVLDIAEAVDGQAGICLDIGHLTLASAALGLDMQAEIQRAGALIASVHVHDNFGGRFYVDRRWNALCRNPDLQDVDTHLPFLTRYCRSSEEKLCVLADNSAFTEIIQGGAHYTLDVDAVLLQGAVPVEQLLSLVPASAHRILEFDSRYAPLRDVLTEYHLARRGDHPRIGNFARGGW